MLFGPVQVSDGARNIINNLFMPHGGKANSLPGSFGHFRIFFNQITSKFSLIAIMVSHHGP